MKSRIKKILIIGTVGLVGLVGATAAFARHGGGAEHRMKWLERVVASKLDLNDEQREKLSLVKQAFLEAKQRNQAERERQHEQLETLLLDDTLDQGQVRELLAAHQRRMSAELPNVLDAASAFHASLSQAQREKAVAALREFKARHAH